MKTNYRQCVEEIHPHINFVSLVDTVQTARQLKPNEYYALIVQSHTKFTPYIIGTCYNTITGNTDNIVGVETTSDGRVYVSKHMRERMNVERGQTVIVSVSNVDLHKCCVLSRN